MLRSILHQAVSMLGCAVLSLPIVPSLPGLHETAIANVYHGSGNIIGWASYTQGYFPMPEYYLNPSPQLDVQVSFNWQSASFTLDTATARISLPPVEKSVSYTVGPGQVDMVTLAVSFEPVQLTFATTGSVPLTPGKGGDYLVDPSLWTGTYGVLPDFDLHGAYTVMGPHTTSNGTFSLKMCSAPNRFLHFYAFGTTSYPDSVTLKGVDMSLEPHWYPENAAPGEPLWQKVFFVDTAVDGYPVKAGLDYVNIDTVASTPIVLVPEPSCLAVLGLGILASLRRSGRMTTSY